MKCQCLKLLGNTNGVRRPFDPSQPFGYRPSIDEESTSKGLKGKREVCNQRRNHELPVKRHANGCQVYGYQMQQKLYREEDEELVGVRSKSRHEVEQHRIEEWDWKIFERDARKPPADDEADGFHNALNSLSIIDFNVDRQAVSLEEEDEIPLQGAC